MMNIHNELEKIFQYVFDDNKMKITDTMDANDILDWDSLAHIEIIIAVEQNFEINFSVQEIADLKNEGQNIGTFKELIKSKLESK